MPDLNANSIEAAMRTIEGTARQMGIAIKGVNDAELAEQAKEAAKEAELQAKREAELEQMEEEAKAEADVNVPVQGDEAKEAESEESAE